MKDRYNKNSVIYYDFNKMKDDISFYLQYAQKMKGEILELGCGTGRVCIPLVENGIRVRAVDYSDNMLKQLKVNSMNIKNRKNLTILKYDLTKINLHKKFNLIILPYRVFQCLLTVHDQIKALQVIKKHLKNKGLFIFDVYFPNFKILADIPSKEIIDAKYKDGKNTIIKSHINRSINLLDQVVNTEIIYYEKKKYKRKILSKNTIKMRYTFKSEMEYLLNSQGFKINNLFSDYKSKKFIAGKDMIFVCKI